MFLSTGGPPGQGPGGPPSRSRSRSRSRGPPGQGPGQGPGGPLVKVLGAPWSRSRSRSRGVPPWSRSRSRSGGPSPRSRSGGPPPRSRSPLVKVPPQVKVWGGPPGQGPGPPGQGPGGPPVKVQKCEEHGRYASCGHAGGLSCLIQSWQICRNEAEVEKHDFLLDYHSETSIRNF